MLSWFRVPIGPAQKKVPDTFSAHQTTSMQNTARLLMIVAVLSLCAVFPAQAQQAEWKRLVQETVSLFRQGRYAQSALSGVQAVRVAEDTFGPDHPNVARSANNLAVVYKSQGQYAQAEPLFRRSLAIREKALGPDHPDVASSLSNLADLYRAQGLYAPAEPLLRRSLVIREKALGPDHADVAVTLNGLALLYEAQRQHAQAEALYQRSLAIWEKALGPDHPSVATGLNNLAALYRTRGQYTQAEPLFRRSLAIMEKALGPDHPNIATSLNNLAGLYSIQGQHAQAEPLLRRSLALREKVLGADHPEIAASLNNLAWLYKNQRQYAQAEPLYRRSLAIWEKALDPDHPHVAASLNNLSELYTNDGQYSQALSTARRASAIYRQRIVAGGTGDAAIREAAQNRFGFVRHLTLLTLNPDKEPADKIADEAFQIVQLEQASGTAAAIAKMAARFAGGNDDLAGLIKRRQDAGDRRMKEEAQLLTAASRPQQQRNAADEQRSRDEAIRAGKDIEAIDAELARRFPEYQELTRSGPLAVNQIREMLKPGEAMLVYSLAGIRSFLWVVKPEGAVFMALRADVRDVAAKVATIRAEMEFDRAGIAARVSVGVLHELYQLLLAPAVLHLSGMRHVMVVPSGPLQSLPFSMLVASPPPQIKSDADYRQVDWLAKHYAFSVLPSVSSIQAFRQFAKAGSAQEPFAGFGDPLIGETGGTTRGKRARMDIAKVFRNLVVKANAKAPTPAQATEIADVEAIRAASRLPETADELRAMAKALKSGPKSLWLQENATEATIKRLDLSKYRTLAFATHGVMAGEVKGIGESGLILTPPREGSLEDDGYLSASEIAKLKLNADWVLLSACNTAAADGTPGAEGLSGLAKAFFYAGARSLLVSHWPVASEATVPLTTAMLKEYAAHPAQGKAEAHRKAMLALIATPNHPEYAHPLFWAPFVVVGEGGAEVRPRRAALGDEAQKKVPDTFSAQRLGVPGGDGGADVSPPRAEPAIRGHAGPARSRVQPARLTPMAGSGV